MNLYHISTQHLSLMDRLVEAEGELTPELEQALQVNQQELQQKAIDYGFIIKQIDADITIIDAEMERLERLKMYRQNAKERLKTSLSNAMQLFGVTEVKTQTLKINFRSSEQVIINDLANIPEVYIRTKTTRDADKIAIKEALKSGEIVSGAELVIKQNIQIK